MCGSTIATCDGLEVSIAQWLQAAGCGVEASVLMNPVVVKPARCGASRLLVSGEVASESFVYPGSRRLRARLRLQVLASALKLSRQCELVIVEGAGAASEVNLSAFDLSNMWLASALRCDVVLVVDVERGGALAAVAGARQLLTETQSSMVIGFVLNRFVGKLSLLMPGVRALEALTSWSCLGVLPKVDGAFRLPHEDALSCDHAPLASKLVVVVVDLPLAIGAGDVDALKLEPGLSVEILKTPPKRVLPGLKLVVLPDAASPAVSVEFLNLSGWPQYLARARDAGVLVLAVGTSFVALCRRYAWGVVECQLAPGLALLNTHALGADVARYALRCECALLAARVHATSSKLVVCLDAWSSRLEPLIVWEGAAWGVRSGNVWGVNVDGLLACDEFRIALLLSLGVVPKVIRFSDSVRRALLNVATELTPHFSARLLAKLAAAC